jgi:MerR family transcriptional regulator, light-induced transcriptional regulator
MAALRGPLIEGGGCYGESIRSDNARHLGAGAAELGDDRRDERLVLLTRAIEGEIIPRLLLAHRVRSSARREPGGTRISADDIIEFASVLLERDTGVAPAFVESLVREGVTLEAVFLDLLTPAARHLGELWKADLCDFSDVTVGLMRLQQLVRSLSPAFEHEAEPASLDCSFLLAPVPGEQHSFGGLIVGEFLRRDGWRVEELTAPALAEVVGTARGAFFDVVGFSLSCERLLDDLAGAIAAVRKASRNRTVWVMVGGRPFSEHPDLVTRVGADATAIDGPDAVRQARHLVWLHAQRGLRAAQAGDN